MDPIEIVSEVACVFVAIAIGATWPPMLSGAFWAMLTFYGIVSVLFDDETPRGIPGIETIKESLRTSDRQSNAGSGSAPQG
ncbi:MAG TPA: hypothetical protein VEF03_02330 [Candidatus Binataceae bacterium]|nr:hypothetical protein [Candidatus Binataceae bacterium]